MDASGYGLQLAGPPGGQELGLGFPGQQGVVSLPAGPLDAMPSLVEQKKPNKKGGVVGQVAPLPQQQAAAPQQLQQVLGR